MVIDVQSISAQHISYRRAAFRKTRYYSQDTQWSLMYSPYLTNTSVIGGRHTQWSLMYSPYLTNTSVIGGRHSGKWQQTQFVWHCIGYGAMYISYHWFHIHCVPSICTENSGHVLFTDFAFRITDLTCCHGPHLHAILRIISRGVSGLATDSPCGVWGRGWTTCLLHDSPLFGSHFKMRVGM